MKRGLICVIGVICERIALSAGEWRSFGVFPDIEFVMNAAFFVEVANKVGSVNCARIRIWFDNWLCMIIEIVIRSRYIATILHGFSVNNVATRIQDGFSRQIINVEGLGSDVSSVIRFPSRKWVRSSDPSVFR